MKSGESLQTIKTTGNDRQTQASIIWLRFVKYFKYSKYLILLAVLPAIRQMSFNLAKIRPR